MTKSLFWTTKLVVQTVPPAYCPFPFSVKALNRTGSVALHKLPCAG
jgi:hypothetical protein